MPTYKMYNNRYFMIKWRRYSGNRETEMQGLMF